MKSNLNRLFFIAILSTTMVACTTNPVVDNSSATVTGNHKPTNGNSDNNTNNSNPSNTNKYTYNNNTNTNTSNTNEYTYTGGVNSNNGTTETNYTTEPTPSINNSSTSNSAQRGFVVQLTASVSQAKTDKIRNTFASEGYPVIQNSINRNGQILYRVQIGPYTSKAEAQQVFTKLRNRYRQNPYINSAFINENK